ncbi:hypothetical protein JRI60_29235 [Archangium violaceum]|uniref:hypothetical protein n=1 Tax=Archangium violaceum TaxID=83451 RepID=UPI00194F248C|nr:hypothetical protein [Archangium violaceum]QRN93275.1 hypothetical protein JRI60_29235 [Archangium violaceum]
MIRGNRWLLLGALAVTISIVGCDCGGTQTNPGDDAGTVPEDSGVVLPPEPDGGVSGNLPDGGTSGVELDGGSGSYCVSAGAVCDRNQGAACCTGVCGEDGRCPEANNLCRSAGEVCATGGQCCSNSCLNGKCSSTLCLDEGGACSTAEQCCSKTCTGGKCAPLADTSDTCKVLGQSCTEATEDQCCSQNCQNGVCSRSWVCKANGDICTQDAECCGNSCTAQPGGVGRCETISGGGGGGCLQDGNPCGSGSNCCSRTCVDLGYGTTVCQPVGGCKLTGNFCTGNAICCGSGTISNVTCNEGRCDNGNACQPTGNICGTGKLPDGGVIKISAPQNCCDGKTDVCKVDSSGVPRCFGGASVCPDGYDSQNPACCINPGNSCQFSDQCCSGSLCLPDSTGNLKCQAPSTGGGADGGAGGTCSPVGTRCDSDGGTTCCPGTQCLRTSELTRACQVPPTQPPPGSDGGTTDGGTGGTPDGGSGGTCSANGATCSGGTQCCSGICSGGLCSAPAVCQPQNGLCTTTADCCSGLRCDVPLGSTVGSCQPGATCSSSGQACSPSALCCSGLSCRNGFGGACDGTSACTCRVVIQ